MEFESKCLNFEFQKAEQMLKNTDNLIKNAKRKKIKKSNSKKTV